MKITEIVEMRWPEASMSSDSTALAMLFAQSADFVTANGYLWQGREEIREGLRVVLEGPFRGSSLRQRVDKIRFLADDIALVHVWMEIAWLDGRARRDRGDRVFVKTDGEWRCLSLQNSAITEPPRGIAQSLPGTQQPLPR